MAACFAGIAFVEAAVAVLVEVEQRCSLDLQERYSFVAGCQNVKSLVLALVPASAPGPGFALA